MLDLPKIESLVSRMYDDLAAYAKRKGANAAYISRKNEEIDQLADFVEAVKNKDIYESTMPGRVARKGSLPSILADVGKLQPQAIEVEEAVLGALMLERDAIVIVLTILIPESFYKDEHKLIFEAMLLLFGDSAPIDLLTVVHKLKTMGKLEEAAGAFYISELTNRVSSAANIEYHSRIIAQKYLLRELIKITTNVQRDAYDEMKDVFDIIDQAKNEIQRIENFALTPQQTILKKSA